MIPLPSAIVCKYNFQCDIKKVEKEEDNNWTKVKVSGVHTPGVHFQQIQLNVRERRAIKKSSL